MKPIQNQMIDELKIYYEANHGKALDERSGKLPSLVSGLEDKINEALEEASSSDDFIRKIIGKMSSNEKKVVKDRMMTRAVEDNA